MKKRQLDGPALKSCNDHRMNIVSYNDSHLRYFFTFIAVLTLIRNSLVVGKQAQREDIAGVHLHKRCISEG